VKSPQEISFRLRQEAANLLFWLRKPARDLEQASPLRGLPDVREAADRLRGTPFAAELIGIADQVLRHRFPILGITVETGPDIAWRRDYVSGRETPPSYFRRVPYLDAGRAGDHKIIWELNRHQHLVLLAQAFLLSGREEFRHETQVQVESWLAQNPFQCGINWASALEVGFRALSWIWVYHLTGMHMPDAFRRRFLAALYQHGCHLEYNLSYYFSRNTHLLGEAVALHAIGALFPEFPNAGRWKTTGAQVVRDELAHQVLPDGAHFEQSTYYHIYALDFFLLHYLIAGRPGDFEPALTRMAEYLQAFSGPSRLNPLIGDDDGGRLFHPYGRHVEYGRATLATSAVVLKRKDWDYEEQDLYPQAAWWLGEEAWTHSSGNVQSKVQSRHFEASGLAVMQAEDVQVLIDAGTFGAGRGGHSHSDTLSIVVRNGTEELLVDSGTYTYVGDRQWRDRFRSTAAHNTVRVDGMDQADPAGPFGWLSKPSVHVHGWSSTLEEDYLDAECSYKGVVHRRRVLYRKPSVIVVTDEVAAPDGEHTIEQFWHFGQNAQALTPNRYRIGSRAAITFDASGMVTCGEGGEYGWRSMALGSKQPAAVACVRASGSSPLRLVTVLDLDADISLGANG
jgi:hypothetical protein